MRTRTVVALLAAALAVTVAALPAGADKPKVKDKVQVDGVVTAIDPIGSAFVLQTSGKQGSHSYVVLVQGATELRAGRAGKGKEGDQGEDEQGDEGDNQAVRRAAISDFHVGDHVRLQAFRLDDGRLVALRAQVLNRAVAFQPQPIPQGLVAQGVVVGRSANTLTVLDRGGATRVVIVPGNAVITGQRSAFAQIIPNDVVRVEGTVNPDNTVTARQVEVLFAGAYQVSGRITFKSPNQQFLLINNTMSVNIAPDTRIISGGQLRSFNDMQTGQTVTVTGTPITVAGITVGISAHVITF